MSACADCGKERAVMLGMRPGRDGVEWFVCSRCWIESTTPKSLGRGTKK